MIVGIDLGTTHSLIGCMDAGFPVLIAGENGSRLTPSVVSISSANETLVGESALRQKALQPAHTIHSVKRLMGRRFEEADLAGLSYAVSGEPGHPALIPLHGRDWRPEEISAEILKKLRTDAERALGKTVDRAVITVPAYFNDAQRNATKLAGEIAGFQVERIINEPTAAALAYGLDKLGETARVAVYDLGGGTFDISILEIRDGVFQVISTNGNTRLGGDDIDLAICERFCERLNTDFQIDPAALDDPLIFARLMTTAREAKERLSSVDSTTISLPFLTANTSPEWDFTRGQLEQIARPFIERTRSHCRRALEDADSAPEDLKNVILVGGSTRMPLVREIVASVFGKAPDLTQNPDEAVAIGATLQAGILSGAVTNMVLLDVTPLSLGIETFGGLMNVIIPRNTTIPTKAGELFTNPVANQSAMLIHLLQGERELAKDNWTLGSFSIEFSPAPRGQARVGVQLSIDANGILQVLARDTQSGTQKTVEIQSVVDVSDEAVEAMIAESVDHAFEDMSARAFAEAKIKAEQMLPAVEHALSSVGDHLEPDELSRIRDLMTAVRDAIEKQDAPALKERIKQLDDATQNLATLLMEAAMEAAMARRASR